MKHDGGDRRTPRIVVTTDFSDDSYGCIAPTVQLARRLGARITLLHAVPRNLPATYYLPLSRPEPDPDLDKVVTQARAQLEDLERRFGANGDFEVEVATGASVPRTILDFAHDHDATLIAMTSHGRSGLSRVILGSVAEAVLRHSHVPVLIHPASGKHGETEAAMPPPHILLTTDFSEDGERAIEPTIAFAKKIGAKVTLLNVIVELATVRSGYMFVYPTAPDHAELVANSRRALEELRDRIGDEADVQTEVILGNSADSAICAFAKDHDIDMIAISTHGRGGLRRILMGSVTEAVLRSSSVPVLVFPPEVEKAP